MIFVAVRLVSAGRGRDIAHRRASVVEGATQGRINIGQSHRQTQIDQAGHAMVANPARNDAVKVAQIRVHIDRQPVKAARVLVRGDVDGFDVSGC